MYRNRMYRGGRRREFASWKSCKQEKCGTLVENEEYCSEHKYRCLGEDGRRPYFLCSERVSSSNGRCFRHQVNCAEPGCQKWLCYWDKYCYDHAPHCQVRYCEYRSTAGENYCPRHKDYNSVSLPSRITLEASSQMQQMVRERLARGENEFECKIEYPVYEKVRYNRGYVHYEKFER